MELLFIFTAIIGIIFAVILNSPSYKGKSGEKIVAERLENIDGHKYIINNIMINDNGKSRQIDHISITEYGVFVIETKNYAGTIYGKETSNEWQQYLNHKCYRFKNPIHQNFGHLQIVKQNIEEITNEVYSLIAFTRRCKLRINTLTPVIYEDQLTKYITEKNKVLSFDKIDAIYQTLLDNKIENKEAIKNHNENVKNYIQYKDDLIKNEICPRCNGKLVKREGKNGQFYGCSNYPNCKFTKNIEDNIKV